MSFVFTAVLPIFALVAVGWGLARTGALAGSVGDGLAMFAATVGIPVLIFRTIVAAEFGDLSPWMLWACYFPAAAVAWALGHLTVRRLFHRDARTAVIAGMGAAFANTAFVGLPLAHRAFGERGVLIVTLLISVHMPLMMTAATVLMARAEAGTTAPTSVVGALGRVCRTLLRNPIVLAIAVGVAVRLAGVRPTGVVDQTIRSLADVAGPVSLVALGMAMQAQGVRGEVLPVAAVSTIKLVVMPGLVLLACRLFGVDAATTGPLVVLAGVPTGINVFMVASRFGAGVRLGSGVVAMTTALGVVSASAWLWALHVL